jgi:general nucleoside transport system permease protein
MRRLLLAVGPLLAVIFAGLVGSLVILTIHKNPLEVYGTMVSFSLERFDSIALILFRSTPLLIAAIAVSIGFRANLFNIGVEGQYFIGSFFAALVGFKLNFLPAFIHLPLTVLAGAFGGMLWAALPAFLKVKRGVHEVITTIMMNSIAYSLVHWLIYVFLDVNQNVPGVGSTRLRTPPVLETARMPTLHAVFNPILSFFGLEIPNHVYLNYFFFIGIALALFISYMILRTPFGLELRAVGLNPDAAETAGIDSKNVQFKTFLMSGAIAGLIGLSDLLSYFGFLDIDFPKGYGFTGIAVALLGKGSPLGMLLSALLFGFLRRGAEGVQVFMGVPMDTIVILEGVMILAIVIATTVFDRYALVAQKKEAEKHASQ